MGKADKSVDKDSVFANYQSVYSKTFVVSLLCEFLGTMLFAFIGTAASYKPDEGNNWGPVANGLALATMIYTAANISGGHLNPAVTMSTLLCGFYPFLHACLYMALQVIGAIVGSLFASALLPGVSVSMGAKGPGCFSMADMTAAGVTTKQVFGWECIMTFMLISVVYACGIAKPGHGSFTPLIVGLTLWACACAGGRYSGAFLNPARVLGPAAVFKCASRLTILSILAQILAALFACAIFAFVSGLGPLHPLTSMKKLGLSWHEALLMWISGSPPARLRTAGKDDENVIELLKGMDSDEELPPSSPREAVRRRTPTKATV